MKLIQTSQVDSNHFFVNNLVAMAYITDHALYNGLRRAWRIHNGKRVYGWVPVYTTFKEVK